MSEHIKIPENVKKGKSAILRNYPFEKGIDNYCLKFPLGSKRVPEDVEFDVHRDCYMFDGVSACDLWEGKRCYEDAVGSNFLSVRNLLRGMIPLWNTRPFTLGTTTAERNENRRLLQTFADMARLTYARSAFNLLEAGELYIQDCISCAIYKSIAPMTECLNYLKKNFPDSTSSSREFQTCDKYIQEIDVLIKVAEIESRYVQNRIKIPSDIDIKKLAHCLREKLDRNHFYMAECVESDCLPDYYSIIFENFLKEHRETLQMQQ